MFNIENWMFKLKLSYGNLIVFAYVYNCIKSNSWNPKEISSQKLAELMYKSQCNISTALNNLCDLGLIENAGKKYNCCMYILTPKVFEVSKEAPVAVVNEDIDYTPQMQQIMDAFRFVWGWDRFAIEEIGKYAIPLLETGCTVDDLCNVIRYRGKQWIGDERKRTWINPRTLFGNNDRFKNDLSEANAKIKFDSINNINIDYIHDVYSHLELNESDNLKEWCLKTLRENADMDVKALGIAIHSIYLDLMRNNKKDWVIKLMSNTKTLSDKLPQYKEFGIKLSKDGFFDDVSHMRKEPVN